MTCRADLETDDLMTDLDTSIFFTPQYKWKKPDKSATLLDVCTVGKARSATCDRLYETGVTALVQALFIFLAALTMFIASRSSGELTDAHCLRSAGR